MTQYAHNSNLDPEYLLDQQVEEIERYGRPTPNRTPTLLVCSLMIFTAIAALVSIPARGEQSQAKSREKEMQPKVAVQKVVKSNQEWRSLLTNEQFQILRQAGTEPAFNNRYHNHKGDGNYACSACGNRLFASSTKFNSGTGWPSFNKTIDSAAVVEKADNTAGLAPRTEVTCSRCDGHLGHVFEDGPQPTGFRYCINSAALTFFADQSAE